MKDYEAVFAKFDEAFQEIMGTTVIDTDKLESYFHDLHTFYLGELKELHERVEALERESE